MADELPPEGTPNGIDTDAPRVQVIGQYIKDLSFENPGVIGSQNTRPQIELNVDLQARQLEQEHFEELVNVRAFLGRDVDKNRFAAPFFGEQLVLREFAADLFGVRRGKVHFVDRHQDRLAAGYDDERFRILVLDGRFRFGEPMRGERAR